MTLGLRIVANEVEGIENLRARGHDSIILVVTLARGVNDNQLGAIINFAARKSRAVRCVNVQPVSITGRIDRDKLAEYRITIPDFMRMVEEQTGGQLKRSDFYPVPTVSYLCQSSWCAQGSKVPRVYNA